MMKQTSLALMLALFCSASSAYAIDTAFVDNTSWQAGPLEDATATPAAQSGPLWVFQKDGTVTAKGSWMGVWASWPGSNELKVTIFLADGKAVDTFEVKFLTPNWFVATKEGKLYRWGKKK